MSVLAGSEIEARVKSGQIVISDFDPRRLGANSYDLRLGSKLLTYDTRLREETASRQYVYRDMRGDWATPLDMAADNPTLEHEIPPEGLVLLPGTLYLGHTMEYTETRDLLPCVEGRSSAGRLGLKVHVTAGFGDVGFCGDWTLELEVTQPLRVYAGVRVCQIFYSTVLGFGKTYCGKYQGQRGPRPSGLWRDFLKPQETSP